MSRRNRRGHSAINQPKIVYLDTNFYHYVRDPSLARRAVSYFVEQGLTVIVSIMHWAELFKADSQHEAIGRFWDDVGAVLVAQSGHTNFRALTAYPRVERAPPLILGPTCEEVARQFLAGRPVEGSPTGFSAAVLFEMLDRQKPDSRVVIEEIKRQFPDAMKKREDFEDRWIIHHLLVNSATRLCPGFTSLKPPLVPGSFPSLRLQGALVWWSHIRAKPPKFASSELGDRGHSEYFYCCNLIVLENHQHEMVCQLRRAAPELFAEDLQTFTTSGFVTFLRGAS